MHAMLIARPRWCARTHCRVRPGALFDHESRRRVAVVPGTARKLRITVLTPMRPLGRRVGPGRFGDRVVEDPAGHAGGPPMMIGW